MIVKMKQNPEHTAPIKVPGMSQPLRVHLGSAKFDIQQKMVLIDDFILDFAFLQGKF